MRELLYRPEVYGRIDIALQEKFKSSYGLSLYENRIRYQNVKSTLGIHLDALRKFMGVEEGMYGIFRNFKRRVLDSAIEDVNRLSTIFVALDLSKIRRAVDSVRFLILPNNIVS